MKRFLLLFLIISFQSSAQNCDCGIRNVKTRWPKAAEENDIYGIVKINYLINDSCIIENPVLIKGLGYGCDEEAMRIFTIVSTYWNQCKRKCGGCNCKKQELTYNVIFTNVTSEVLINRIIYGIKCFFIRFRIS